MIFRFLYFYGPFSAKKREKTIFDRKWPLQIQKTEKIWYMRLWRDMRWRSGPMFGPINWSVEKLFQFSTIFGKSRLKFDKCKENGHFHEILHAISLQRIKLYQFCKKTFSSPHWPLSYNFHLIFWPRTPTPHPLSP